MDKGKMNDDQLDAVTGGSVISYSVQSGDTLRAIAARFNVPVDKLVEWNKIQDPNVITVGSTLKVKF